MLTLKMLRELAEQLPLNSAYYQQVLGQRAWGGCQLALGQCYQLVLSDVSIGWNLPLAYTRNQQPMPLFIQNRKGLLLRAFNYITNLNTKDTALAMAHGLWLDPIQRPVLEALLL